MRVPSALFARSMMVCLAASATPMTAQTELPTEWNASLVSPGGALLFGLELGRADGKWHAAIRNGGERIEVPTVRFDGKQLLLGFDHYDSTIRAELADGQLLGKWRKRRGAGRWTEMVFEAMPTDSIAPAPGATEIAELPRRWAVDFARDEHPAVGIFDVEPSGTATGTFLTTLGDYRYLAGSFRQGQLELSCFDGAHAFLFRAERRDDGTLRGEFWSSANWHEKWTAKVDSKAKLPDAWRLTEWKGGAGGFGDLAYPDLDGKVRRLDDPAFAGKARVLVVFGSWCPNCHDEARYLAELDEKYRARGLRILGLAFEHTGDLERDRAQVRTFAKHHGIEFPILVAGLSDKAKATQAFPLLDRVRSYPTTVFLDRAGKLHSIHTGFSGPATGEAHTELRKRFERSIEELLGDAKESAAKKR